MSSLSITASAAATPDAVVGAQRGAVRFQPVAIPDQPDGIGVEVVGGALVLFADHVQVALQGRWNCTLASGGSRFADHEVSGTVLDWVKTQARGLRQNVVACRGLFGGSAGYRRESREVTPQGLRLEDSSVQFP